MGEQAVFNDNACKGGKGSAAVFPVFLGGMAERFAADLIKVIKSKSLYGLIDGNRSQYGAPYKVEVFSTSSRSRRFIAAIIIPPFPLSPHDAVFSLV